MRKKQECKACTKGIVRNQVCDRCGVAYPTWKSTAKLETLSRMERFRVLRERKRILSEERKMPYSPVEFVFVEDK